MTEPNNETTMSELFARNPLQLGDQDITRIIEKLRSQRAAFVAGNMKAGTPANKKSKTTEKQEAALKVTGGLDLDNLGL